MRSCRAVIQFAWRQGGWTIRSNLPLQSGIPVLVRKKSGDLVEKTPGLLLFKSKSFYIYEIQETPDDSDWLAWAPELVEEGD